MSKRIEIVLKPEQFELQDTINEKLRDVQHLPDRNGGTDIILSVPANSDLTFLDEIGVQYSVIKPGRPVSSEYKDVKRRPITVQWPAELINYIDSVTGNRTKWLIEAAEERRKREEHAAQ